MSDRMTKTPPTRPMLAVSQRTALVTVDFVRACLGVDADSVLARVDAGELRWVWDVSSGQGKVRALRFLSRELAAPERVRNLTPRAVVAELLGNRNRWRGVEVAQLLLVSRTQIFRLHKANELSGDIVSGTLWVPRPALENFLLGRVA